MLKFMRQFISLWVLNRLVRMAIPPLNEEELRERAGKVVIGKVKEIRHQEKKLAEESSNNEYVAVLETIKEEQSLVSLIAGPGGESVGDPLPPVLEVHYWQAGQRPDGWTGPVGQHSALKQGEMVRVFVVKADDGTWHLLEPNGWQSVE